MPIERKDRSFDRIFDEVEVHSVPPKYLMAVQIVLATGDTIEVNDFDEAQVIIENLSRDEVVDVNISLDYESIKSDVTGEVKSVLDSYFKDDDK